MKINKIFSLLMGSVTLLFCACQPIVDSESLSNTTDVAGVELVATQSTSGGNEITLQMATPGVTGYWQHALGKVFSDKFTVAYPVTGTFDFTFVGTLGKEFFEKTVSVSVENLDTPVAPEWAFLLGDDAIAGKTWVFAGTGGDKGLWWYMSPPDDPASYTTAWWNAGGSGEGVPIDVAGSMTFDLDGAANFTYVSGPGATPQAGKFSLDPINQTLQIINSNILGAEEPRGNPDGLYQIISLTDTEMILWVPTNGGNTGWTWVFKPQ